MRPVIGKNRELIDDFRRVVRAARKTTRGRPSAAPSSDLNTLFHGVNGYTAKNRLLEAQAAARWKHINDVYTVHRKEKKNEEKDGEENKKRWEGRKRMRQV